MSKSERKERIEFRKNNYFNLVESKVFIGIVEVTEDDYFSPYSMVRFIKDNFPNNANTRKIDVCSSIKVRFVVKYSGKQNGEDVSHEYECEEIVDIGGWNTVSRAYDWFTHLAEWIISCNATIEDYLTIVEEHMEFLGSDYNLANIAMGCADEDPLKIIDLSILDKPEELGEIITFYGGGDECYDEEEVVDPDIQKQWLEANCKPLGLTWVCITGQWPVGGIDNSNKEFIGL